MGSVVVRGMGKIRKKYRDEIAKICHEIVKDGHLLGKITDTEIREFETDCFVSDLKSDEPEPVHVVRNTIGMEHATV